jgi:hypothetical protein
MHRLDSILVGRVDAVPERLRKEPVEEVVERLRR